MTDTSLASQTPRVHLALIEALRQVDAVCKELNITYWVDGGTLLGTVRHLGPIPWDDDIDLCMNRAQLARFVARAPELLGVRYSVQTPADDPAIAVDAKIYLNGTHIRSKTAELHGLPPTAHDGLYVDIALMDPVSKSSHIRKLERQVSWLVSTRHWSGQMARSKHIRSKRVRARWALAARVPAPMIDAAQRWLTKRVAARDGSLYSVGIAGLCSGYPYPPETIYPLTTGEFADLTVPIPADPRAYLVGEYGANFMQLPPEDQRVTHTDEVIFDGG